MVNSFSHVGVVVANLDEAIDFWTSAFGLVLVKTFEVDAEDVRAALLAVPGEPPQGTFIELLQPRDLSNPTAAIAVRLRSHGEGVFHLAFTVEDSEHAGSQLVARGVTPIQLPAVDQGGATRLVVRPRDANGVLIELIE